ncbi:Rhodopirellula transposase [Aquisphaera giovannonii]|uniref:Rhodopirellula transposase n=1 Tax=Aquisphaera giovannonii TaxID=406548 RepID=A0A5B9W4S1_9BACT|nr:Rhodopirellula transposase [Aquisphaera giovannonii]QEH35666.1 Rhodopirellula transposase [Aquisphaera giovannonii]QEH36501.1 Rhodopirellula transposase [Aquisphaera giovannonii]QEH36740.1 Rhodopirellula transposase [Aquisphaera giovannonii]QEH38833.1 Rhodopirellula transposase [Aquisphaera giovannonii]
MQDATRIERIRAKFCALDAVLDERSRRQWAAAEAREYGYGGVTALSLATGLARNTIAAGMRELEYRELHPDEPVSTRLRHSGAGRKRRTEADPDLAAALEALLEPLTRGDPMSPLRWTCKSTRRLAAELSGQGHRVGYRTVAWLLHEAGYSLQANRKTREGNQHPDRNAQFEFINAQAARFQKRRQPVISVDTKKKELIGDFKNGGREWRPEGRPEPVRVHDFRDKELGKAIPYGVYDVTNNQGWVSVGIDHDTAYFAAASIGRWWREMGAPRFPRATELFITADGGGSNGYRTRLWKVALQGLADQIGLKLTVSHFPPGTSKWNKVEHRLFSFITQNWRGKPLVSVQVIVNLIAATRTKKGLVVRAALDEGKYETGIIVTDEQMAGLQLKPASFHGEWNYTIKPRSRT